jgi:hypothetical protein
MVTTTRTQDFTLRRERLLNFITVRFAHMVPLLSILPRGTATHTVTEYGVDAPFAAGDAIRDISDPHATAKLEGATFTDDDLGQPTKLRCITEIKSRSHKMTGSAIPANVAGMNNPWDYNSGKLFTKLLNSLDNTLMYGLGSPEVNGTTNARQMLGLIGWAAVTGLERSHGAGTEDAITDPYGINIPKAYWSVFYDAEHKNLTSDLMFQQIMVPLLRNGALMDGEKGWVWQVGYELMGRVSRFINPEGFVTLETKNRDADASRGQDYMTTFKFPTGQIATFMTNRWLDVHDLTYEFGSADPVTPGTPTSPGTVAARTFDGNATMIGHEPGRAQLLFYREPGFRPLPSDGDFSRIGALLEATLQVDSPLCVGGGGNLLG